MLLVSLRYPELCKIIVVLHVRYTFIATGVRFHVIEPELMSRFTVRFIDTIIGSWVRLG
jgi:hypothetical protein